MTKKYDHVAYCNRLLVVSDSSAARHSPGPWHIHNNAAGQDEVCRQDGSVVAYFQGTDAEEALLLAAPEMLELLREASGGDWCDGELAGRIRALLARL